MTLRGKMSVSTDKRNLNEVLIWDVAQIRTRQRRERLWTPPFSPYVTARSFLYYFRQTILIWAIVTFAAHASYICYNIITTQKSAGFNPIGVCLVAAVGVRYRHLYSFVTKYGCRYAHQQHTGTINPHAVPNQLRLLSIVPGECFRFIRTV